MYVASALCYDVVTSAVTVCLMSLSMAGVSCDSCMKSGFSGIRYKCLVCCDYDLCSACYDAKLVTSRHKVDHAMQCLLTKSDVGQCSVVNHNLVSYPEILFSSYLPNLFAEQLTEYDCNMIQWTERKKWYYLALTDITPICMDDWVSAIIGFTCCLMEPRKNWGHVGRIQYRSTEWQAIDSKKARHVSHILVHLVTQRCDGTVKNDLTDCRFTRPESYRNTGTVKGF